MTSHRDLLTAQIAATDVSQDKPGPLPVQPLYFLQSDFRPASPKSGPCIEWRGNPDAELPRPDCASPVTESLGPMWLGVSQ
jgi:hypothetical protein